MAAVTQPRPLSTRQFLGFAVGSAGSTLHGQLHRDGLDAVGVRSASSEHHWRVIHLSRRWVLGAELELTVITTTINFEALMTVMSGLVHAVKGATGASFLVDDMNI
jgi:hypothetical protein